VVVYNKYQAEQRPPATNTRRRNMAKFEVYQSANGYRWRLKASNGEVVAVGEEYTSKDGAKKGCEAVVRAAAEADIVEV